MNILLMSKDIVVMKINFDEGIYDILEPKLLPYQLQGKLVEIPELSESPTKYEMTQILRANRKNNIAIEHFLAERVLPITRSNAKKVYSLFGFEQLQSDYEKAKIAITCRAISLQDTYWIKNEDDTVTWNDVNLRVQPLSEIVAQVSLHGTSLSLQGHIHTPELNGQGAYAKAWFRENDKLVLHKKGTKGSNESEIEVMVSNLLDICNVNHVEYKEGNSDGHYVCKCECITTDDLAILPGLDFYSYCISNDLDFTSEIFKIDSESIYKMWIVDYLISNSDRHGMNWGFFYDSNTMEIKGCHPLFDHNNAFNEELMKNKDAEYIFDRTKTMKEAALYAMKKVDFHFYRTPERSDFLTNEQYKSFMDRVKDLNIQIKPQTLDEKISSLSEKHNSHAINKEELTR